MQTSLVGFKTSTSGVHLKQHRSNNARVSARTSVHCVNRQQDDVDTNKPGNTRRDVLVQTTLAALATTNAFFSTESAQAMPPGFKKDLSKGRNRTQIPVEAYKEGPEGLKYYDLSVGSGREAKFGDRVAVHYDVKWRGITFFSTRVGEGVNGGSPAGFDVGAPPGQGGTLKGIDYMVRGMHIGGQRLAIIPANLAYGSKGFGEIPPNATLTVDMQLLSIKQNAFGSAVKIVEG